MERKTRTQIDAEIRRLSALEGKLRGSHFGDDNNAAVTAQIMVLRGQVSEQQTFEREESEEWTEHEANAARDACSWMVGQYTEESLAAEWEPLSADASRRIEEGK